MMMQLPSEHTSSWETALVALLTTVGAGGALKLYSQWQAGKSSIRAETATRIRALEEQVAMLQREQGELREKYGRALGELELLRAEREKRSTPP